jgi:hypothetical protein
LEEPFLNVGSTIFSLVLMAIIVWTTILTLPHIGFDSDTGQWTELPTADSDNEELKANFDKCLVFVVIFTLEAMTRFWVRRNRS